MFGLADHPAVELRESPLSGRGLYVRRPVAAGDVLLHGVAPIAFGKDYNEIIGKVLLRKTLDELAGVDPAASPMLALSQLVYPTNLSASAAGATTAATVPAAEVALGTQLVATYINRHAGGKFEVDGGAVGSAAYLRLWGVLFLNAIRSPADGDLHLYGAVSLLNHSCFPTCALRFDAPGAGGAAGAVSVVVRGPAALRAGTQATIDYVEGQAVRERWSKKKRKRHLHDNYGIVCTMDPSTCSCTQPPS